MDVIDTHFHVWNPELREHEWLEHVPSLQRPFSVEDFSASVRPHGVSGGILVQVLNDLDETYEFCRLAEVHEIVAGVVGWVDLEAKDLVETLEQLRSASGGTQLVGIRHLVQDEADPSFIERPSVVAGLRQVGVAGLAYDLLVRPHQLAAAVRALHMADGLSVVLDHGGKPPIGVDDDEEWAEGVRALAALESVSCKISGLVTEAGADWRPEQITRYIETLLDWFGPKRLLFGSDWPVCTAVASYGQVFDLTTSALAGLSASEQEDILAANARRVYGLAN